MLVAHLVARNEADRYLSACLAALAPLVDHIHLFDDRSTDATPFIADAMGVEVHVRPISCPSFLDHEGQFRQAAWESMGTLPQGSWVVCVDTDEFFSAPLPDPEGFGKAFQVREIFDVVDGQAMVRIDGYWDRVIAARMAPWSANSEFPDIPMGCGSLPIELGAGEFEVVDQPAILHYGYANPDDRLAKYHRYRNHRGHNPRHVESIVQHGKLRPL